MVCAMMLDMYVIREKLFDIGDDFDITDGPAAWPFTSTARL